MSDGRRGPRRRLSLDQRCQRRIWTDRLPLVGCDDDVAFGLAVVAHALHAVDLGQLVDDLPVFSVHGREAVAPLCLFSLISELGKILDLLLYLCDKFQVFSGVVFEAVAVYGGGADVEGVRGRVYL